MSILIESLSITRESLLYIIGASLFFALIGAYMEELEAWFKKLWVRKRKV
jgi:hypothetical protein